MTTSADAIDALRAHAERILDNSAMPAAEREDVAEELYGHLWQRWQDELAAGRDEQAALEAAIAAFGGPSDLGKEMTLAYHSRLYATTIGVLLPAITPSSQRPAGYTTARVIVGLWAALLAVGVVFTVPTGAFTPIRGLVASLVCLCGMAMAVLAYRALARRQRWALVYVQILLVALILRGSAVLADTIAKGGVTVDFMALVALIGIVTIRRSNWKSWVAGSRPVGLGLAAVIVVTVGMPFGAPVAVGAIPDPTVASADDLSMQAHVDCARTSQGVTGGTVTVDLVWKRTDFLPYGPNWFITGIPRTDAISLASVGQQDYSGPGFEFPSQSGIAYEDPSFVDAATGKKADADMFASSGNTFFNGDRMLTSVDPATTVSGRTYRGTYGFTLQAPAPADDEPVFRVGYDHQSRSGVEAIATCGQIVTGHSVLTPEHPVTYLP